MQALRLCPSLLRVVPVSPPSDLELRAGEVAVFDSPTDDRPAVARTVEWLMEALLPPHRRFGTRAVCALIADFAVATPAMARKALARAVSVTSRRSGAKLLRRFAFGEAGLDAPYISDIVLSDADVAAAHSTIPTGVREGGLLAHHIRAKHEHHTVTDDDWWPEKHVGFTGWYGYCMPDDGNRTAYHRGELHDEAHLLPSANVLIHTGPDPAAQCVYWLLPVQTRDNIRRYAAVMNAVYGQETADFSSVADHPNVAPITLLLSCGVRFRVVRQRLGQTVVTGPGATHCVYSPSGSIKIARNCVTYEGLTLALRRGRTISVESATQAKARSRDLWAPPLLGTPVRYAMALCEADAAANGGQLPIAGARFIDSLRDELQRRRTAAADPSQLTGVRPTASTAEPAIEGTAAAFTTYAAPWTAVQLMGSDEMDEIESRIERLWERSCRHPS